MIDPMRLGRAGVIQRAADVAETIVDEMDKRVDEGRLSFASGMTEGALAGVFVRRSSATA